MFRCYIFLILLIIGTHQITCYPARLDSETSQIPEQSNNIHSTKFWIKLMATTILVLLGGLFAGLTLGLMTLDETNLYILTTSGDSTEKKYAERIYPIRKNGHLLLVTLLLCNVLVNETLPIVMDELIGGGLIAILISSVLIVIFGEIIPQAVCSRYGLAIGAFFSWPVKILISLTFVISYPISKLLDYVLGKEHGIIYRRSELKELIKYHETTKDHGGDLVSDSVTIIRGAIDLQEKTALIAMTPIADTYMISYDTLLDKQTVEDIAKAGLSRIPVYVGSREHIIGVFLTKSLILYNPEDAVPLHTFTINKIPTVEANMPLFDMLNTFQEGKSHIAMVVETKNPFSSPLGIITLEDVLEELIQEEIYDESDQKIGLDTGDQTVLEEKKRCNTINDPITLERIRVAFKSRSLTRPRSLPLLSDSRQIPYISRIPSTPLLKFNGS